ncbi:MAG: beta-xylosidase, partial [Massilia sp.]
GVPASADPGLLTHLLREDWGFTGTVIADYFGVGFLQTQHRIAGTEAGAAHAALTAVAMLAALDDALAIRLQDFRSQQTAAAKAMTLPTV